MRNFLKTAIGIGALILVAYAMTVKPPAALETIKAENSAPAIPGCHGHSTADGWTFDTQLSPSEAREINAIVKRMKQLDPHGKHPDDEGSHVANVIDQLQCNGASHDEAVETVIGITSAMGEFRR